MTDLVCNRDAFTEEEAPHYEELLATWRGAIEEQQRLDEGIEFLLRDDGTLRSTLEAFIPYEQRCCPFFSFDVQAAGPAHLRFRMTGPPGTRQFIESEMEG